TLVLDVNGEMIEAAKALGGLVITLPDPEKFGISLNMMTPQELVAVAPNVQAGTTYAELIEAAHEKMRGKSRGHAPVLVEDLVAEIRSAGTATKVAPSSIGAA